MVGTANENAAGIRTVTSVKDPKIIQVFFFLVFANFVISFFIFASFLRFGFRRSVLCGVCLVCYDFSLQYVTCKLFDIVSISQNS